MLCFSFKDKSNSIKKAKKHIFESIHDVYKEKAKSMKSQVVVNVVHDASGFQLYNFKDLFLTFGKSLDLFQYVLLKN